MKNAKNKMHPGKIFKNLCMQGNRSILLLAYKLLQPLNLVFLSTHIPVIRWRSCVLH